MAKKETKEKFEAIEVASTEFSNYVNIEANNCYRKKGYVSPVKRQRISIGSHRWYIDKSVYDRGATFLSDKIQHLLGDNQYMTSWRKAFVASELNGDGNGEAKFDTWLSGLADFGTMNHELLDQDVSSGFRITDNEIAEAVTQFGKKHSLSDNTKFLAQCKAAKAVLSFRSFVKDYQLDIIAMEEMATCRSIQTSTPIDIFALGEYKGEKLIVFANFKTSESSGTFHKWQCAIEYMCATESLDLKAYIAQGYKPMVCTVRPKDWRLKSGATYEVVDYTEFAQSEFATETISSVSKILISAGQYKKPSMAYPSLDSSVEGGYVIKDAFI